MKTKKINRFYLLVCLIFGSCFSATGQATSVKYDLASMAEASQLDVINRKVSTFSEDDKRGIRFSKNEDDGVAWLKHVIFTNGIIEVDIRGKDENPSFAGVAFHGTDNKTLDVVYFRPFNFQSTDSVHKIHSVQYISGPEYPWEVLREKFNGIYEKEITPAPNGNEWFHAKIVVNYPHITVFVNGNPKPCLSVDKLNDKTSGKIGLWVGNNSEGDFANLQIMSLE